MVADVLLDHGFNVNEQEPTTDKSLSGYALPSAPSLTTSLPSLTTSSFFALPPPHPLGLLLSHTIGLPSPLILPRPSLAAPLLPPSPPLTLPWPPRQALASPPSPRCPLLYPPLVLPSHSPLAASPGTCRCTGPRTRGTRRCSSCCSRAAPPSASRTSTATARRSSRRRRASRRSSSCSRRPRRSRWDGLLMASDLLLIRFWSASDLLLVASDGF